MNLTQLEEIKTQAFYWVEFRVRSGLWNPWKSSKMQVFEVFEKSLNCVKKRRKSLNSLVRNWLYDFLADKIDWLNQDFHKYRRKCAFYDVIWRDINYWVKMVLTLAIFRQLIALKVFENRQKKSLKAFEYFWFWRLRTLEFHISTEPICWVCTFLAY
jgi:hypothetical protein